ncbi:GDP-mannose 4,6-dehydratase [Cohnella sp. 56]|uniref:GDP-mannose 4,6-dehydratase n=1 Tax=Cohnella sp. 56 TaxID=3113722 RepID=UPI0030E8BE45
MKALITGGTGFVGRYLIEHLTQLGYEIAVVNRASSSALPGFKNVQQHLIELADESLMQKFINKYQPEHIYHLAGFSSVRDSWDSKKEAFQSNVMDTLSFFEVIRKSSVAQKVRVLTVGSSEEYGRVTDLMKPIVENTKRNPISPYGISKATTQMLAKQYYESYGINVIHARPFNHIGPRQRLGFVATDFAKQIAEIEVNLRPPALRVGNLMAERDFSDVRDIVTAYEMLLRLGESGQTYNVCSGVPTAIKSILEYYTFYSIRKDITIEVDQALFRPIDVPSYVGDPQKLRNQTGWENRIALQDSLKDVLNYWRGEIRATEGYFSNV